MGVTNLNYVILLCEDLAQMESFYHELLGFPIERDWEDWIELRAGSVLLTLRSRGRPYDGPRRAPGARAGEASGSAGRQLAFRVMPGEVNDWFVQLLEKRVEILEPPHDWDYGHRTLFFKDPEGNILEIYAEI